MGKNEILVCVDGSDYTEPSLLHAAWLADRLGIQKLYVSHIADVSKYQVPFVNELGAGIGLQPCNGLFSEIHKQEQELLEALRERIRNSLEIADWRGEFEFVVERGRPAEALHLKEASRRFAGVVVGKRGESFSEDKDHLGANLGKFLREVSVPCLMSSRQFRSIREIAVVLMQDQDWQSAVGFLNEHLSLLRGSRVHLLHSFLDNLPSEFEELQEQIKSEGIELNVDLLEHQENAAVARKVKQADADMMLIAAQRDATLLQWFTTPVAKGIIKECRIPILLCQKG